jgi:hypothetical protein
MWKYVAIVAVIILLLLWATDLLFVPMPPARTAERWRTRYLR